MEEMEEAIKKEARWFAMSATYRKELQMQEYLNGLGVECFVPLRYEIVQDRYSRKIRKTVPAISNLIFVHATQEKIQEAKTGIQYLQYKTQPEAGRNVPITVPEKQMKDFMTVCQSYNEGLVYISSGSQMPCLKKGTKIRIKGGELDGVEGNFVKIGGKRKKRVLIEIPQIAGVITAEISDGLIEILK